MMKNINIGIIGVGVVGSSVIKILQENKEIISARAGVNLVVKKGIVKDLAKIRNVNIPLSQNIDEIFNDQEIDIVIELMGGVQEAYEIAKKALQSKKALVTANKAMLAYHRYDLQKIANDIPIGFEASVCGGIPIIKALKDGLGANHILALKGILNGTSNYILTQMIQNNQDFSSALLDAQNLGYAEADPSLDVNGGDAGHKLLILASLAYGIDAKPQDIIIEGIESINSDDIEFANEFGYSIKLLGIAKKEENEIELRVHPAMINKNKMISKVEGVMNGISVIGDRVGETLYYGAGAGGDATASAVISDLIEIARGKSSLMLGFENSPHIPFSLKPKDSIKTHYYVRLLTIDKPGVLAQIASILSKNNISISAFLQKESKQKNTAKILFATHITTEYAIKNTISEIKKLDSILQEPYMIRIEDE
ncbi:homoserine dehydrogenase [Helicobacter cappadocius]|uniref:Homoserine dehydrogenase n=1 Tax=Helicobacter cappadocius TaxID=3063998 RepID=A0AA90PJX3_9HELI|nr:MULTISPECIES: homoserine dehydrogenase [unclassified Helicobacter]MDO7252672.1 homoserine dehydrogenase [Helicobacter sp. faydin-H75]MDP2538539.1 homoserine dehydrogenase [Helicobacter sp. faydin-H76]